MSDALNCLLTEARKSKFSTIGQSLSDDDVANIWNSVSAFIEKHMAIQKGVHISGIGVFSFAPKKIDISNNKHILVQRPVFMLSEKFAQTHGLTYSKYHSPGQIPIVQLNYAAISCSSSYDRDSVESCIREVLLALNRSVAAKKNVEFTFTGIGRLQIREGRAKMKFFRCFVNSIDGSGSLAESMRNRPGTVDSVISERCPSRLATPNTLLLPCLRGSGDAAAATVGRVAMPTIGEEEHVATDPRVTYDLADTRAADDLADPGVTDGVTEPGVTHDLGTHEVNYLAVTENDADEAILNNEEEPDDSARGPVSALAHVTGVCFEDYPAYELDSTRPNVHPLSKSSPEPLSEHMPSARTPFSLNRLSPLHDNCQDRPSPLFDETDHELKPPTPPAELRPVGKSLRWRSNLRSSCGHRNAGQELCYLCHQRQTLNVPVSFTEERARRDREEDRLQQKYAEFKDTEALLKDEAQNIARKHWDQKTAAFNLGVSEAIKQKKQDRPINFYPSYVFQRRPYTPPRYIKQNELYGALGAQCLERRVKTEAQLADEQFMERLEQVQLAEDLAAQRNQYLKDKFEQREQYKRALSAQVRCKTASLPGVESDSLEPVFGRGDVTQEKLLERRRIAHELYKEHLESAAQKKREAILKRLAAQSEEEGVLRRTKEELIQDRVSRYDRMVRMRKHLENNWTGAAEVKMSRERDERRLTASPGILLHEQCDKYRRCRSCKRTLGNCGESNIWCDTRYIPGTRLMV